jgi:hypothetical protein|tara:strand:- start:584 stop:1093 length:510 start_codon:yes stop_codon:yes gene_type:complete
MTVGQQLDISSTVSGGLPKPLPDDVSKTYDVSSNWDCGPCCTGSLITLTLEAEEVVLNSENCMESKSKRLPYGELGSVDQSKNACGCYNIGGESIGTVSPGWGSLKELPEMLAILATLKHRQQQRGDQGQIQRTENLERKIDAIIQHFRIQLPDVLDTDEAPGAISMKR